MAWWRRMLGIEQKITMQEVIDAIYGKGQVARTGKTITVTTALEVTVVLACARAISEGLSQIPFRMMRRADNRRAPAAEHPIYPLFAWAPNEFQSSTELMDQLGMHLVLAGNAYAWKVRGYDGSILEILPFEPSWVAVDFKYERTGWRYEYTVTIPGLMPVKVPPADIWHLRGPSWAAWHGLPALKLAREAVGIAVAGDELTAALARDGPQLAGVLTTDQRLDQPARDALRKAWQSRYGGADNAGKTAVLSHGIKFAPVASTLVDAQFLEQRRFQIEEVCRAFRVMPIMVGYSDKATTYASAEQMFLAHAVHTMGPWYARIEASANITLLTPREREEGYYFKFFNQALLRGASKDRAEFYRQMVANGLMSPNEVRDLEDLNPYPGGEVFTRQINMGAIDAQGMTATPEPAQPPAGAPPQE